jgi:osmotically-inducible protein OsmY
MSVQMEQKVSKSFEIAAIAEACLSASSHPALRKVFCKYDDGVLVLRGRLNSFFHTQLAQETVRKVAGVERVVNQIEIVTQMI